MPYLQMERAIPVLPVTVKEFNMKLTAYLLSFGQKFMLTGKYSMNGVSEERVHGSKSCQYNKVYFHQQCKWPCRDAGLVRYEEGAQSLCPQIPFDWLHA